MKKIYLLLCALFIGASLMAQTTAEEYQRRYDRLSEKVGAAGLGVETLLGKWEKDFPDDPGMLEAKFLF